MENIECIRASRSIPQARKELSFSVSKQKKKKESLVRHQSEHELNQNLFVVVVFLFPIMLDSVTSD